LDSKPVSLVIAARNELANLQRNLPLWLNQQHPDFEIIIADDGSTDGTSEWIVSQMEFHPKLKLVLLDPEYVKMHGKKIALTLAFKKAVHNRFVLTDADCTPATEQWLSIMASELHGSKEIVIGYSPYQKTSGLLNQLIRYETLQTGMQCFGFAKKGKPYMAVGRNLAYTRSIYDHVKGFSSHSHVPAGDDDLFIQSAAHANNTALCLVPEAYTVSIPKSNWKAWWRQKQRHLWTGKFYSSSSKNMLAVLPVVQYLLILVMIAWIVLGSAWWYACMALFIKFVPEWIIKAKKCTVFQTKDLRFAIPYLSVVYLFFYAILGISAFFARRPKW
jgi:cellulose synthase/poly-beta-1,6-N-acetylglucosamine synthase-like glycosyltransferase